MKYVCPDLPGSPWDYVTVSWVLRGLRALVNPDQARAVGLLEDVFVPELVILPEVWHEGLQWTKRGPPKVLSHEQALALETELEMFLEMCLDARDREGT